MFAYHSLSIKRGPGDEAHYLSLLNLISVGFTVAGIILRGPHKGRGGGGGGGGEGVGGKETKPSDS